MPSIQNTINNGSARSCILCRGPHLWPTSRCSHGAVTRRAYSTSRIRASPHAVWHAFAEAAPQYFCSLRSFRADTLTCRHVAPCAAPARRLASCNRLASAPRRAVAAGRVVHKRGGSFQQEALVTRNRTDTRRVCDAPADGRCRGPGPCRGASPLLEDIDIVNGIMPSTVPSDLSLISSGRRTVHRAVPRCVV